jgi:hypothetical protein
LVVLGPETSFVANPLVSSNYLQMAKAVASSIGAAVACLTPGAVMSLRWPLRTKSGSLSSSDKLLVRYMLTR